MGALPAFAETTVYVDARIRPLASVYAECAFLIKGSSGGGVRRRLNSENYHYFDYSQIKPEDEDNDKYSCTLPTGDSLSNAASDRGISFDGDIYITLRAWNSALGESGDSMSCHSLEYYGDIASGVEGQHYVVYKGGTSDQSCPAESKPKLYEVSPASGSLPTIAGNGEVVLKADIDSFSNAFVECEYSASTSIGLVAIAELTLNETSPSREGFYSCPFLQRMTSLMLCHPGVYQAIVYLNSLLLSLDLSPVKEEMHMKIARPVYHRQVSV